MATTEPDDQAPTRSNVLPNENPSPEEAAANNDLIGLSTRIEALTDRMGEKPREPGVLSSLWVDNKASNPFQVSHAAWGAIMHAGDSLVAAYDMTVTRKTENHYSILTRPYAIYPMLRASFENACRSLWLTTGPTREERVRRRFRMQLLDARMFDEVAVKSKGHPGGREAETRARLKPLAQAAGVSMNSLKPNLSYAEIVRGGVAITSVAPDTAEVLWRCLSGLTHGDYWAMLSMLDREEVSASKDGRSVTLLTTSSSERVATFMEIALQITETAIWAYDDGCTARFRA